MPTAFGYLRVSTGKQGTLGLDAQKQIVQDLWEKILKDKYPEIVYYADEDVSARSIEFNKRPKAKEMNLRIQKGDCIIFPKLDRGFRSLKDSLNMLDYWTNTGIRVYCPDFGIGQVFDSGSLVGKMLVVMLGICAEIEGDRSKQRMADWSESQRRMGRASAGFAPYGFKFVRHGEPTGAKRQPPALLQPNDAELAVMKWIDQQKLKGIGYDRITKHLNKLGMMKRDGKPWMKCIVLKVHKNYEKLVAYRVKLKLVRGFDLRPWEFITPDGVLCKRLDMPEEKTSGQ